MIAEIVSLPPLQVRLFSFGFKYGIPTDVNHLWDVRFLPNPYWVEDMRPRTGLERDVAGYVVDSAEGREFLRLIEPLVLFLVTCYAETNKPELKFGIGCTGGRHRSVAIVESLRRILQKLPVALTVFHRDIEKG